MSINRSIALAFLGGALLLSYQNCMQQPTAATTDSLGATDSANGTDALYRLPGAGINPTGTNLSCSAVASLSNVGVGATQTYTISTVGNLPAGFSIYTYGSKDGIVDIYGENPSSSVIMNDIANNGTRGGSYTRSFQVRDSSGRALCQTNSVSFTMSGNDCSVSMTNNVLAVGDPIVVTIAFNPALPAGATLSWYGTNNGLAATEPWGTGTNYLQWARNTTVLDRGTTYVRKLVVVTSTGAQFCESNPLTYSVQ